MKILAIMALTFSSMAYAGYSVNSPDVIISLEDENNLVITTSVTGFGRYSIFPSLQLKSVLRGLN